MRPFLRFVICFFVLVILASLGISQRYPIRYPRPGAPELDVQVRTVYRDIIDERQPRVVFMGDSTLRESVDFEQLDQLMGMKTYGIAIPGSTSALWYLIMKSNLAQVSHTPDYLVIFFRESILTTPEYRVDGRYFATLDEFASPKDDLFLQLSYLEPMNMVEQLATAFLPLYGERQQVRASIDDQIDHTLPLFLSGCGADCVAQAGNDVFYTKVNAAALNLEQDASDSFLWRYDHLLFERQLERSYLPEIVRIAEEKEIKLIFVEVKTLMSPGSSTAKLMREAYFHDLRAYASENGISFVSFAGDPRIPKELFSDNIHLLPESVPVFTELLAEELKPLIK